MKTKIGMLSLGCARNLVDSEIILGYLKAAGFTICEEIGDAEVAIVNTCCFIQEAQEESLEAIFRLIQLKQAGEIAKIIVCGCLPQRYKEELIGELREVDAFVGPGSIDKIGEVVQQVLAGRTPANRFCPPQFLYAHHSPRLFLTPAHFAYVKISEGCNHRCSFCIIPALRGKYRSRPIESILKETDFLFCKRQVKEVNLIGQDTTMYGRDLYGQRKIAQLLKRLARKADGKWLRLLYAHPAGFPRELLPVIRDESSICKYLDLPFQHINDKILKRMRRGTSRKQILTLIETLRKAIPHLFLRTTLIVGFPGETDAQFGELLDFIRQIRFERLGLFKYSREMGTCAYDFTPQIPEKIKQTRYDTALKVQQDISCQINAGFLGKEIDVLIDDQDAQDRNLYLGRTQYDAPEVDGCVYVRSPQSLARGDFVRVKIRDTWEYDLVAELI